MAELYFPQATLLTTLDALASVPTLQEQWRKKVKSQNLSPIADAVIFQLFSPKQEVDFIALSDFFDFLKDNQDSGAEFSSDQLGALSSDPAQLGDHLFQRYVANTIVQAVVQSDVDRAIVLRNYLEKQVMNDLTKVSQLFGQEIAVFYERGYIILANYFFANLSDGVMLSFLTTDLVVKAFQLKCNIEEAIRRFIDYFRDVTYRHEYALDFAGALGNNQTLLVKSAAGEKLTVSYWIDSFRAFSKNAFGGIDLLNFLNEKQTTAKLTGDQKDLIRQLLELYTHLINGFLTAPGGDVDAVIRLADRLDTVPSPRSIVEAEQILNPPQDWETILSLPLSEEQQLAIGEWFGNFFDDKGVKAALQDRLGNLDLETEPFLSNVLCLNGIFEGFFPEAGPLVYFDEATEKFVWDLN